MKTAEMRKPEEKEEKNASKTGADGKIHGDETFAKPKSINDEILSEMKKKDQEKSSLNRQRDTDQIQKSKLQKQIITEEVEKEDEKKMILGKNIAKQNIANDSEVHVRTLNTEIFKSLKLGIDNPHIDLSGNHSINRLRINTKTKQHN